MKNENGEIGDHKRPTYKFVGLRELIRHPFLFIFVTCLLACLSQIIIITGAVPSLHALTVMPLGKSLIRLAVIL